MNLQELYFKIGMHDHITGTVGKVQKSLDGMAKTARQSFLQIGTGAVGMWGAGEAMSAMIDPARQMNRSLGEVKSLGVAEAGLKQLNRTSLAFSIQFGEDAAAVAASAYDIQSSIAGLNANELARFTKASNVLAKGTKADAATITDYMGTMYGIFKGQADKMGKGAWVEQLAGQTATAVQMFKTTGAEMAGAFGSVGAAATSAGINASEQMAILGTLQSTMSGSEAGTKYKAFLAGVGGAQDKLGLKFTDSNGNMLGMMDILTKLRGKFGDTFDVAESDALKKAFGSDEAVGMIKLLMADVDGLGKSISTLGGIKGMDKAKQMAMSMVDPFDRMAQGGQALKIVLGQALLPAFNPLADGFANMTASMVEWADKYPNLTRWIGYGIAAVVGFGAVLGAASMAAGVMRVATFGLTNIMKPMSFALGLGKKAWAAYSACQWVANAALWGFPGTWVVAALVGLAAAVGAAIYWWDDLTGAMMEIGWVRDLVDGFSSIGNGIMEPINQALAWWDELTASFANTAWAQPILSVFRFLTDITPFSLLLTFFQDGFSGVFDQILGWFKGLGGAVGWLIEKLNILPGVNIDTSQSSTAAMQDSTIQPVQVSSQALEQSRTPRVATGGGITNNIASSVSNASSSTTTIGKQEIRIEGNADASTIGNELAMGV